MATCAAPGCDRPARSRGYCNTHYFRWYRTGSAGTAPIKGAPPPCKVEGCARKHSTRGYCLLHWRRVQKGGHPDYAPSVAGANNPAWIGDAVGYGAAHERVTATRGPARQYECACGSRARHWAYTHDDPNEKFTPMGLPYSPDPRFYVARCVPCHKRLDLARLAAAN